MLGPNKGTFKEKGTLNKQTRVYILLLGLYAGLSGVTCEK